MRRERFVAERRARWERLEGLIGRGRPGRLRGLSSDEILELGRLYRATTSDLAIARRDFPRDRLTDYLNNLLARAHPLVYRERPTGLRQIARFARYGFPAAYRAAGLYVGAAFALFFLAALISALLVTVNGATADVLLPGQAQSLRAIMEQHHLWMKSATANHSVAANFIMLNNIQVAFIAFAGGILLGTATVYVLIQNGILLGTVAAMVAQYGLSGAFWSFVLPHGVLELSVIWMAGGAGLMMGDAVLRPGLLRRRDALVRAARIAVQLVFGAVPLLTVAGTIEGFFSASDAPVPLKLALGIGTGIAFYSYVLLSHPPIPRRLYRFEESLAAPASPSALGHSAAP